MWPPALQAPWLEVLPCYKLKVSAAPGTPAAHTSVNFSKQSAALPRGAAAQGAPSTACAVRGADDNTWMELLAICWAGRLAVRAALCIAFRPLAG